jgi:hypothetical protein
VDKDVGRTMSKMHDSSKTKFGSVRQEPAKSRTRLEELMSMNADRQDIRWVTYHMNELLYREDMLWLQRSWLTWLN